MRILGPLDALQNSCRPVEQVDEVGNLHHRGDDALESSVERPDRRGQGNGQLVFRVIAHAGIENRHASGFDGLLEPPALAAILGQARLVRPDDEPAFGVGHADPLIGGVVLDEAIEIGGQGGSIGPACNGQRRQRFDIASSPSNHGFQLAGRVAGGLHQAMSRSGDQTAFDRAGSPSDTKYHYTRNEADEQGGESMRPLCI